MKASLKKNTNQTQPKNPNPQSQNKPTPKPSSMSSLLANSVFLLDKEQGVPQDRRPPGPSSASLRTPAPRTPAPSRGSALHIVRHRRLLRSFIRVPRVQITMCCSFRWEEGLCSFAITDPDVMNRVLWVCLTPRAMQESQILPVAQRGGVSWGKLGSAEEGNHYRDAKNY